MQIKHDHLIETDPYEPFRLLAKRWRQASAEYKRLWDRKDDYQKDYSEEIKAANAPFYKSCYIRYVDYERRASDLEILIRAQERIRLGDVS